MIIFLDCSPGNNCFPTGLTPGTGLPDETQNAAPFKANVRSTAIVFQCERVPRNIWDNLLLFSRSSHSPERPAPDLLCPETLSGQAWRPHRPTDPRVPWWLPFAVGVR